MKPLAIPDRQRPKNRLADPGRLFENCVEDRYQIAGRGVDDLQHLGSRSLAVEGLIEPPLQLGVSSAKFGYLVIERRGHVLTPSRPASGSMILRSASTSQPRRA